VVDKDSDGAQAENGASTVLSIHVRGMMLMNCDTAVQVSVEAALLNEPLQHTGEVLLAEKPQQIVEAVDVGKLSSFKYETAEGTLLSQLKQSMLGAEAAGGRALLLRIYKTTGLGDVEEVGSVDIKLEALLEAQSHTFEQRIMGTGTDGGAHIGRVKLSVLVPPRALLLTQGLRAASRMQEVAALCARAGRHAEATALLQLSHQRKPFALVERKHLAPVAAPAATAAPAAAAPAAAAAAPAAEVTQLELTKDLQGRLAAGQMLLEAGAEAPWPATLVELSRGAEQEFAELAVRLSGRVDGGKSDPFAVGALVLCPQRYGGGRTLGAIETRPSDGEGLRCYVVRTQDGRKQSVRVHQCLTMSQGGVGGLLREAAATGLLSLLEQLLHNKVSVFETDAQATSALHRAASAGQGDACRLLCRFGAVGFTTNAQNLSAHGLAVQHQHNDVRRVFQPSAADRDIEEARQGGNRKSFKVELTEEWKVESEPPFVTPLMRAARSGNLDDVNRLIINEGIKQLHMRSKRRSSALLMAAEGGHVEVMTALFESKRKAGLEATTQEQFTVDDADADGCTALHLTAANGHLPALNKLLDQNPALDKRTKLGETPLFTAAKHGYDSVVSRLLEAKANATASADDVTPLMAAAGNGMAKVGP
jgi:ankyrin repeat protein